MATQNLLMHLIMSYSNIIGISSDIPIAVATVESSMSMEAVGAKGEIGAFQLLPEAYPEYTKEELKKPEINVMLGILTLKKVKKRCKHKVDYTWLTCYNQGITGGSRLKHPQKHPYVNKVRNIINRRKEK